MAADAVNAKLYPIVARELGIAAVVGTADATEALASESTVTVSCAQGDIGYVYRGELETVVVEIDDAALAHLARVCDGDARRALTALEVGVAWERGVPIVGVRTDFRESQDRGVNLVIALVGDMLVRQRLNQEEVLYFLKRELYAQGEPDGG